MPLKAKSVATFLVNSRGWSFLRVVFSQTRNFAVIAFTGWIYRIVIFFTLPWKTVRSEIFLCIEYIFYHSGFLSNLRLPWKTEIALNSLYWIYIFYHAGFFSNLCLSWKQSWPENFHCIEIHFLFRIFKQLVLALKNRVVRKFFTVLKYFLSFRIFE